MPGSGNFIRRKLLHAVEEVAVEMVRWKVVGQTAVLRPLELQEVVERPQSEQQEVMERQPSELQEVLLIEQPVLRHRREAVAHYPVYLFNSRSCPLSSQMG